MATGPDRVLVLGGSGMLGHEAVRTLAEDFEVQATVRHPAAAGRIGLPARLHAFDAMDPGALPGLLDQSGARVAINCIGLVKQLEEASQPIPSITVNSLFPHLLAEACQERGIRLIHVSTDCVFSGGLVPPGRYCEGDPPDPQDLYGRSKLLGEVTGSSVLTLRTSIIGRELQRRSGLLEWLISQAGEPIRGFTRALFSGLTTTALARVVADVVREAPDLRGLYHVASEPISKHDLVVRLNHALELGCRIEPADEPQVNRALDGSRFEAATGIGVPSWSEMIDRYARRVHEPQAR